MQSFGPSDGQCGVHGWGRAWTGEQWAGMDVVAGIANGHPRATIAPYRPVPAPAQPPILGSRVDIHSGPCRKHQISKYWRLVGASAKSADAGFNKKLTGSSRWADAPSRILPLAKWPARTP